MGRVSNDYMKVCNQDSLSIAGEVSGIKTHDFRWYEMSANQHAARYFSLYYGVDWNRPFGLNPGTTIETFYPTRRR